MISYETNNSYCPNQKNIGRSLKAHILLTRAHRKIQAHKPNFDTLRHYVTPISNRNEKRTLKPTRIHLKYNFKISGGGGGNAGGARTTHPPTSKYWQMTPWWVYVGGCVWITTVKKTNNCAKSSVLVFKL